MGQTEHENLNVFYGNVLNKIYYKRCKKQSLRSVFGFVITNYSVMIFFFGQYALERIVP